MKFITLLLPLFISISIFANQDDLMNDLEALEQKYNIDLSDVIYKENTRPNNAIKILEDAAGNLRKTNEGNFFLNNEKKSIDLFKSQMRTSGGSRVGNGGDILLCGNSIEVLDSYRAKNYSSDKMAINEEATPAAIIEKLENTIPHLGKSLRVFISNYKERQSFSDSTYWSPEDELINIEDEELMSKLPADCSLVQAVVRFKTARKIFFFNKEVFSNISEEQLSWILVHEWLWDYLKSSSDIRDVNHFLHSYEFIDANESEMMSFLNKFDFNVDKTQLYTNLTKKREVTLKAIREFITTIDKIKIDLDSHIFLLEMDNYFSKFDTDFIEDKEVMAGFESLIEKLKKYTTKRIAYLATNNKGKIERDILKQINEYIYSDSMSTNMKLSFVAMTDDLYEIKNLTQKGIAKIYIEKKFWFVLPTTRDKALEKMAILDLEYSQHKLTIDEYMKKLFKAFGVKRPRKFKNL
ncbi:hypothetical protein ACRXCV_03255 [Halobacteriovorax sp. GFR7]|uniref:hypothetical protein n=1 Tax=unclassified Halobacteriovorax TaxID=2639665 RepID=UPI003D99C2DB